MIQKILPFLTGCLLLGVNAWAGPLYDPFLERFQVGAYSDPDKIILEYGFPTELLEPVRLDETWTLAARQVLSDMGNDGASSITRDLLFGHQGGQGVSVWRTDMEQVIRELESGTLGHLPGDDLLPLAAARGTRAVFRHLESGRVMQAAALALRLRDSGRELGLADREVFVWDLRAKLLMRKAGNKTADFVGSWPTMLPLGPYDTGNAWALWIAHCREAGASPVPPVMTSEKWGRHLARLGRSWLKPADLYESQLPFDFKAGLGAVYFKGSERDDHFLKFPDPPTDKSLQGLWIRGRRLQSGGDPAVYETMAARPDLEPGWRMDIWRRASELRLLKGNWAKGLEDLEQALQIAARKEGHWTTRRRLRQWNEQALVLALAKEDPATAQTLLELGLKYFQDKDREAFFQETSHWTNRLEPQAGGQAYGGDIPDISRALVEKGQVADLGPVDPARQEAFAAAADRSLWDLWIKWGLVLSNPDPVQGVTRERAIAYGQALEAMKSQPDFGATRRAALGLIAERLGDKPVFDRMLGQAFDHDVGTASGWQVAPDPSKVPDLLPLLKGSELDRHALLGFALAVGDMRGTLAVAVELEGRGLTPEEKRRFLYPLPHPGAIFTALTEAESDPALLLAVARNESLFEPSVRSRAGALGWMQIMPFHYEERGALPGRNNWRNPGVSIIRGDGLLRENSRRYGGDPYLAVAAYNAGPKAASRWKQQLGGSPDRDVYLAWIGYPETRHYVEKVLIDREIYDWIIRADFPD